MFIVFTLISNINFFVFTGFLRFPCKCGSLSILNVFVVGHGGALGCITVT